MLSVRAPGKISGQGPPTPGQEVLNPLAMGRPWGYRAFRNEVLSIVSQGWIPFSSGHWKTFSARNDLFLRIINYHFRGARSFPLIFPLLTGFHPSVVRPDAPRAAPAKGPDKGLCTHPPTALSLCRSVRALAPSGRQGGCAGQLAPAGTSCEGRTALSSASAGHGWVGGLQPSGFLKIRPQEMLSVRAPRSDGLKRCCP